MPDGPQILCRFERIKAEREGRKGYAKDAGRGCAAVQILRGFDRYQG
jgi:hypothetical protein